MEKRLRRTPQLAVCSLAATTLTAVCISMGCNSEAVTAPPAPVAPVFGPSNGLPAVNGQITLRTITHQSGDAIALEQCGGRAGRPWWPDLCTDGLQATFEVVVDRDIPDATVQVTFIGHRRRCAVGRTDLAVFAHVPAPARLASIDYYTRDGDSSPVALGCDGPPTETSVMRVELLGAGGEPSTEEVLVTVDFPYEYRWTMR